MNGVVVGVDESAGAQQALRWAHAYGELRKQRVTALMAWDYIAQRHADSRAGFDAEYSPEVAEDELGKLVDQALGPNSGVALNPVLDQAESALQAASQTADLVVVGARGLGGFRGLLLGSVSRSVVHHSACPVAVVRGDTEALTGPVVVGVNGSEHSVRALRWAAGFAADAGCRVVAVWAWQVPVAGGPFHPVPVDFESVAQGAAHALQHTVEEAQLTGVEQRIVEGQPAAQLLAVAEAERASLVVVGARGATGLAGALLGSVSDQVVQHGTTPAVVVP